MYEKPRIFTQCSDCIWNVNLAEGRKKLLHCTKEKPLVKCAAVRERIRASLYCTVNMKKYKNVMFKNKMIDYAYYRGTQINSYEDL